MRYFLIKRRCVYHVEAGIITWRLSFIFSFCPMLFLFNLLLRFKRLFRYSDFLVFNFDWICLKRVCYKKPVCQVFKKQSFLFTLRNLSTGQKLLLELFCLLDQYRKLDKQKQTRFLMRSVYTNEPPVDAKMFRCKPCKNLVFYFCFPIFFGVTIYVVSSNVQQNQI